ncbi:MAG: hypothetical protein FWE35_13620 [Streptosporangiales bacterium]|nr:hypothetical protein [Streptosporangiales bacterium]
MRASTRIGIVGSGFAVVGSAALAALAPSAVASSGYNSTAAAESGSVNIGGTPATAVSASATPSNSPQASSVPSSSLTDELNGGLQGLSGNVLSSSPDLVAVEATATSSGQSSGCAIVLGSNCDDGGTPLKFTLDAGTLAGSGVGSLPLVTVIVNGPKASCSAGPDGSGLNASDDQGTITASVAGGQPVSLSPGDNLFGALGLSDLGKQISITPVIGQGHHHIGGGKASATAGEIGLDGPSGPIFDVKGATTTCGPNNAAAGSGSPGKPGSPGAPGAPGGNGSPGSNGAPGTNGLTSTSVPSSTSTSGESPLGGGIQTDEGRSASSSAPGWLALNGNL